jgi:hypothetical protein
VTLFEDICEVHGGVLKAPPLNRYGGATTISDAQDYAHSADKTNPNHEHVYNDAKCLAIESVRIMQLASKNTEKERQEAENRKAPTARTLYDVVNHDEQESCKTCADFKRCKRHESITWCINWNETIQKDEPDYVFEVGISLGTVRKQ